MSEKPERPKLRHAGYVDLSQLDGMFEFPKDEQRIAAERASGPLWRQKAFGGRTPADLELVVKTYVDLLPENEQKDACISGDHALGVINHVGRAQLGGGTLEGPYVKQEIFEKMMAEGFLMPKQGVSSPITQRPREWLQYAVKMQSYNAENQK